MIDLAVLEGSSFVGLGLARSGLATVRALRAAGIDCIAWDDNAASRDAAAHLGARIADPATIDWSGITALVIGFIFLVRYAVPAVLEAHFAGSLITASVVGIAGVLALVWAAWKLFAWASRALGSGGDHQ